MSRTFKVEFPGTSFAPVELPEGSNLSEVLTAENSPVLFGCRTGICGTCLGKIESTALIEPPDADEQEVLEVLADDEPTARLCCQIELKSDLKIVHLGA
ncbi:MAG: 2Fe-2S iron-sulfur cluster-binding protein [Myxococcota bacterium]|nr:2Fe-2S iron-sulfur cluster-binding protein [Myxococcota bacterium]